MGFGAKLMDAHREARAVALAKHFGKSNSYLMESVFGNLATELM